MRERSDYPEALGIAPSVRPADVGAVYPLTLGRMISTGAPARPGRTCAGTPHPAQNRRYATAYSGPGHTATPAETGLVSGEGVAWQSGHRASHRIEEATVPVQPSTTTAQQATEYVDPADLICPECGEQVRCEPPGYWLVTWGLPASGFSHEDATALCLARSTGRPAEPVEIDR